MALSLATLTEGGSATDTDTSYNTASITPSANQLVIAAVAKTASTPTTNTLSGNGLTWVLIDSAVIGSLRVDVYRAMGASPSSGAVNIDVAEWTTRIYWGIYEVDGVDTSGTDGSGAVRNNANNTASATSLTVTLGAFDDAANGVFAAYGRNIIPNGNDPDTGWTELEDAGIDGFLGFYAQWLASNDTTATATDDGVSGSSDWAGVAFEIVAAGPQNLPGVHYGVRIK